MPRRIRSSLHILVATEEDYFGLLEQRGETASFEGWVVPGEAEPGDEVFFFFAKSFVARGVVASTPAKGTFRGTPAFRADVEDVELLLPPVEVEVARRLFTSWGWLSYPRTRTSVPMEIAGAVSKLLCQSVASSAKPASRNQPKKQKRAVVSK